MSDNPWRLYRHEWVTVHCITESGVGSENIIANAWVDENLRDRVKPGEISLSVNTEGTLLFTCCVNVFKPNLKGEFKHLVAAENFARMRDYDEYIIVERNSPEDQKIRSYGVVIM